MSKRMLSDIEIAQKAKPRLIAEIAQQVGLRSDEYELYGNYKAKVSLDVFKRLAKRKDGKLIFVTAITPTPAGEGKTCTAIGLTQALGRLGKKVVLCLREPSLGPVFGIKGGAAGGGYAQVLPMEDINLHFTGDIHAVGSAHNLLSAIIDNHILKGNQLGIDPLRVIWRRAIDISDRMLRKIIIGLGGKSYGYPRESGFDITVASEVMAILALAKDMSDLKRRLGNIIVAYHYDGSPVFARELKVTGAMALLLKDAIKPNLIQTLEGQPVFMHAGPFANIAHGNNSLIATSLALKLGDYVVTEGGFGADLGMEKFFDIVCRIGGIKPDAVVLVATLRALKYHAGCNGNELLRVNISALEKGAENLERHVQNIRKFGIQPVVCINRFLSDDKKELEFLRNYCRDNLKVKAVVSEVVAKGGKGGIELAQAVLENMKECPARFRYLYSLQLPLKKKIEVLATELYGAEGVDYAPKAEKEILRLEKFGFGKMPINMARTQLSFTDNPKLRGAPKGWRLNVRDVFVSSGAGFVVAVTGEMMLMPGLPKHPAAEKIDIKEDGKIIGLF